MKRFDLKDFNLHDLLATQPIRSNQKLKENETVHFDFFIIFCICKCGKIFILFSNPNLLIFMQEETPEGCQFCVDDVMTFFNADITEEAIAEEINILERICVDFEDFEGCQTGIVTWWPMIARKIFVKKGAEYICRAIDPTCDYSVRTWDCDACKQDVFAVTQVLTSDAAAADLVKKLSGTSN